MILVALFFFYLVGFAILHFTRKLTFSLPMALGLAFGLGTGAIGLQLFLYSLAGIPWHLLTILAPWLLFSIFSFKRITSLFTGKMSVPRMSIVEKVFGGVIAATVMYVFVQASINPLSSWDGIATWLMAAKGFFVDQSVTIAFYEYVHFDNPPLIPLQLVFTYLLTGGITEGALLLFPCYYVHLLLVFFAVLRSTMGRFPSLFFTFLLATMQPVIRQAGKFDVGYVDLPLAYFFLLSAALLVWYVKKRSLALLLLSNVFGSFAVLVKNDALPFYILLVSVSLVTILKRKESSHIAALLLGFGVVSVWYIFRIVALPQSYLAEGVFITSRFVPVVLASAKEMFNLIRWHLLWICFFFFLILDRKIRENIVLLLLIFGQLLSYLFIFLMTPLDPIAQIHGSYDRLLLQLSPLTLWYVGVRSYAILTRNVKKSKKKAALSRFFNA